MVSEWVVRARESERVCAECALWHNEQVCQPGRGRAAAEGLMGAHLQHSLLDHGVDARSEEELE